MNPKTLIEAAHSFEDQEWFIAVLTIDCYDYPIFSLTAHANDEMVYLLHPAMIMPVDEDKDYDSYNDMFVDNAQELCVFTENAVVALHVDQVKSAVSPNKEASLAYKTWVLSSIEFHAERHEAYKETILEDGVPQIPKWSQLQLGDMDELEQYIESDLSGDINKKDSSVSSNDEPFKLSSSHTLH